ncbi:hypothetical protein PRIPAC_84033, partial [Pristionchus pacificus]|uniref:Uncharacterized protein n=1 Tax=Pristionchus pacificus TaxID=54126 RepID=A0A2A6BV06_PRIPA
AEFATLIQKGERMIAAEHYAKGEIRSRCAQLEETLAKLCSEWQLRNSYLAQEEFEKEVSSSVGDLESAASSRGQGIVNESAVSNFNLLFTF